MKILFDNLRMLWDYWFGFKEARESMGYTICDMNGDPKPLRIIAPNVHGVPEAKAAFTPFWWTCDPCNVQERRFEVTYRADQEHCQYFAWYQIATSDDSSDDIAAKVYYYQRVIDAQNAMNQAAAEYRRLTGCGWSATPLGAAAATEVRK